MTEPELATQIRGLFSGKNVEEHLEFRDIQGILDNDLFRAFEKKLEGSDWADDERERLREMTIRAFMEAGV